MTKAEIIDHLNTLLKGKFNGDVHAMFSHYANITGLLDSSCLVSALADAGAGNVITRRVYALAILESVDADGDGRISEKELIAAMGKDLK